MPSRADQHSKTMSLNDPGGDRFAHIFAHLPIALWQTDHTALVERFEDLRRQGVDDLDAHMLSHPEFVMEALDLVRVEAVNDRTIQLFGGSSSADFVGMPIRRFWLRSPETFRRSICARFAGAHGYVEEMEALDLHGAVLPVEFSIAFAPPLFGRSLSVVSTVDIGERVRAHRAIRASEERYRELFRNVPVPLIYLDMRDAFRLLESLRQEHGGGLEQHVRRADDFPQKFAQAIKLQEANLAAAELFGLKEAADFPDSVSDAWSVSPETLRRSCLARIRGESGYAEETKICTLDGGIVDVMFTITFATGLADPQSNIAAFVDVSDRVKAEAALQKLKADFAHAARVSLVGELAGSIAHEVNQPLTGIIATAEMMQRWLDRPKADLGEVRGLASDVLDDGRRAVAIIANIRGMMAKKEPDWQLQCVSGIVQDAATFVARELRTARITLTVEQEEDLPLVRVDHIQIQQVIVNLLMNAIQALEQGESSGRSISVSSCALDDQRVRVTVSDSGPGIGTDVIDRIFGSFVTTKPNGLGIGLAICRSIVEAHGGHLNAVSGTDGATFSFTLPVEALAPRADF